MSLFGKYKTEEKKKDDKKSAVVGAGKKAKPEAKKSMKDLYGAGKEKVAAAPVAKGEEKPSFVPPSGTMEDKSEVKKEAAVSNAYRVLIRPLVTEKGSHLGAENKYLFEVGYDTNKIEVAKAIESVYGVKPTKVNMIKLAGKVVRRGRTEGRRKNWKKAIVTLPAGSTIQIYEGI
ncbi:MAG: 50S ribosomal protein L23 [Patescibacteria group bacterium]|nr:50S ribosomal protein L23 [Patescibacteria group bacterium]